MCTEGAFDVNEVNESSFTAQARAMVFDSPLFHVDVPSFRTVTHQPGGAAIFGLSRNPPRRSHREALELVAPPYSIPCAQRTATPRAIKITTLWVIVSLEPSVIKQYHLAQTVVGGSML